MTKSTGKFSPDTVPSSNPNLGQTGILQFDDVLQEIGEFGRYQILNGILTCLITAISTCALFNFVFSAAFLDHRCVIPECESVSNATFQPDWLNNAIPFDNGKPMQCQRYQIRSQGENISRLEETCPRHQFDTSNKIGCSKIIVKDNEERLANRLNMFCTGNEYQLAFIGTANTFGRFIIMPIVGIISDKFGRLNMIVGSSIIGTILGILQSFANSFVMYTILEFFVAMANAGILSTAFIYNAEWVTSKHRVALLCINGVGNAIGGTAIGLAALYFRGNFRAFQLSIFLPGLSVILFYFVLGESPRWLLARQKYARAIRSICYAAKINGKSLTDTTMQTIKNKSIHGVGSARICVRNRDDTTFWQVIREKRLALRLIVLSAVWIFALFAYYGVILGSTHVHDNKYMSFIIVSVAEVPGVFVGLSILDRLGRRRTVGGMLLVCGVTIVASSFLSSRAIMQLILFVIGKATLTTVLVSLYTYTSELWPTTVRNLMVNICSMLGRIGAVLASFTVLLMKDYPHLPLGICGGMAALGAILIFAILPETLNKKLPDTIDDALEIGRKK